MTYSVWVGDTTGLKNTQVVTAQVITGAYQSLAPDGEWIDLAKEFGE